MPLLVAVDLKSIPSAVELQKEYVDIQLPDYGALVKELSESHTGLSEDPVKKGITTLNALIAQIDAFKTRAASIVSLAIKNENDFEVLYKKAQAIYQREYDSRLPQSPVADFSNAQSREAACNSLLANLKSLLQAIEGSYSQSKSFTRIANNEFAKLDSTNKNISRQITVVQLAAEIGEIGRPVSLGEPQKYTF